jgi:hypothetical protein
VDRAAFRQSTSADTKKPADGTKKSADPGENSSVLFFRPKSLCFGTLARSFGNFRRIVRL